jgi:hypothetical protein
VQLDQLTPQLGVALSEATLLAFHLGDRGGQLALSLEHLGSVTNATPMPWLDFGHWLLPFDNVMGKPLEHAAGV